MLQPMAEKVMDYVREEGYLPGEYLYELTERLRDQLPEAGYGRQLDEQLADVLTQLVRDGKLKLHVRKGTFLHVHPTA